MPRSLLSSRVARAVDPLRGDPFRRGGAGLRRRTGGRRCGPTWRPGGRVRRPAARCRGSPPSRQHRAQAVAGALGDGRLDELALAAVPLRRDDHPAGDRRRDRAPSSRRTRCRQASMPAAVPALVMMSPSSTKSTSRSTRARGYAASRPRSSSASRRRGRRAARPRRGRRPRCRPTAGSRPRRGPGAARRAALGENSRHWSPGPRRGRRPPGLQPVGHVERETVEQVDRLARGARHRPGSRSGGRPASVRSIPNTSWTTPNSNAATSSIRTTAIFRSMRASMAEISRRLSIVPIVAGSR